MKVCIIGAGDAGAIAALQIRCLDSKAEIDVFSKSAELGCPACEMPLVLRGSVAHWEELVRGLLTKPFYERGTLYLLLTICGKLFSTVRS
jgi:NADPH-dependent 2,4-dienoyl-CoA reductase/sulfur reductase-like enzyme